MVSGKHRNDQISPVGILADTGSQVHEKKVVKEGADWWSGTRGIVSGYCTGTYGRWRGLEIVFDNIRGQ